MACSAFDTEYFTSEEGGGAALEVILFYLDQMWPVLHLLEQICDLPNTKMFPVISGTGNEPPWT